MKRKGLIISTSLSLIFLTSCSLFSKKVWSWEESTKGNSINYCLLIGQIDHNDSMYRTRGIRQILDTRVPKEQQKDNYNQEGHKQGEITLGNESIGEQKFVVNELESLEQKSFSGATWDPITANGTAAAWTAKYGKNLTMFISNNDGMAEGAIKAFNWYEGMPIFGYDANTSTLKLINQDKIMGTIDSNTVAQCLVTSVLIRNIHNASKSGKITNLWNERHIPYNPIYDGFKYDEKKYADEASLVSESPVKVGGHIKLSYGQGEGYVHSGVTFDGCLNNDLVDNPESHHAILLKNRTVTKDKYTAEVDPNAIETNFFFDTDGTVLTPKELYDKTEGDGVEDKNPIKPFKQEEAVRLWQSWYSSTDTFFTGNMDPHFETTQADNMFNLNVTPAKSNGSDESINLDALSAVLTKKEDERPNAFLINPVQQPNSIQYIQKIASAYNLKEEEEWINRSDIPVIFWNRQPTDRHGLISSESVMNNKYFKYTYYVGFDAQQGGELQGEMVKAWLNKQYINSKEESK